MANEPKTEGDEERIRAFIALELSDEQRAKIGDLMGRLKKGVLFTKADPRWTYPASIHLTLKFLGSIAPERVEPALKAMRQAAGGVPAFAFAARGVGVFPNEWKPRVVWVGVKRGADEVRALQRRLDVALADLGFPLDEREFHPHLTLARLKSPRGAKELMNVLKMHNRVFCGEAEARRLVLYRSRLHPDGARYSVLGEASLDAAPLSSPPADDDTASAILRANRPDETRK